MKQLILSLFLAMQFGAFAQCPLNADFTYSISSGTINFTNTSTSEPSTAYYDWWYGSQNSTLENPVFTQDTSDQTVCFTVYDSTWTCYDSVCVVIPGDQNSCSLNLSWTESTSGGDITFTNTSTGEPTSASYAWLYGAQTSSLENPTFTFDPAVTQVCFAINDLTGNYCDDSTCASVYAVDSCDINASWTTFESGGNITFTNTSTNEPANPGYYWEYGGQTSTDENPTFFYSLGFTTACLTVWDIMGSCSDTLCGPVVLDSVACDLDISWTESTTGNSISFTNTSTGVPLGASYWWDYGSQYSSLENPTFNVETGASSACFTIMGPGGYCADTLCDMVYVDTVGCTLNIGYNYSIGTSTISFTNTSTGVPSGAIFWWDYGTQYSSLENPTFNLEPGVTNACFTVMGPGGLCSDTLCNAIYIDSTQCNLNIDYTYYIGTTTISFTNTSTGVPSGAQFWWDYGSQYSFDENPTFNLEPGLNYACFTVMGPGGYCSDTICNQIDADSAQCNLNVDFTYVNSLTTLSFTNTSTGVPAGATFWWDYGTQYSTVEDPVFYIEPGVNNACLTVMGPGGYCSDTVCVTIDLDSNGFCNLNADFTMTIDSGYVYFTNASTGEPLDANYDWWYDSQSSSDENPSFVLNDSGAWACFTVYDSIWSCYDSTCFFIEPATAFTNEIEEVEVQLFPNPASNEVNLIFSKAGSAEISIYDASGRLVKQLNTLNMSEQLIIDVADFEKGVYIINVIDSETNTALSKRFMKL